MKVILLEDIAGTGNAGEVVDVKNGYARNKLLPSGIAIEANAANMKTLEHRRAKIAAKKTADKEMAQVLADQIEGKQVDFLAKAGESGKLFGSVTAHDIAEALAEKLGFEIDRRKLLLDSPLKEVGLHDVRYRVYPEVEATIKVSIISEGAPTLPTEEALRDTYADSDLEYEERADDDSYGNYVGDIRDEADNGQADAEADEADEAQEGRGGELPPAINEADEADESDSDE